MSRPLLLLVDDSPEMGILIKEHGRRANLEVRHCLGVEEGWASLSERLPDLLLLDMQLAGESGAELSQRVRAEPATAALRVALFTHWGLDRYIAAGLEAGADLLFPKDLVAQPFNWKVRLDEILAWQRGRTWQNLVACKTDTAWPAPPLDCLAVYNRALQQMLARRLVSAELLYVLLQRAVRQTLLQAQCRDAPASWVDTAEVALLEQRIAASADATTVAYLGAMLAEQLWCLLGSQDSALFRAALSPVIPGLSEALLH